MAAEMEAGTAAKETVFAEKAKVKRTTEKKAVKATTDSVVAVSKHATPARAEPVKFRTLVLIGVAAVSGATVSGAAVSSVAVSGAAVSGAVLTPQSALGLRQRVENTMPSSWLLYGEPTGL